ncbi:MAG: hypothetical protein V1813_03000, partial [Candidatus Aenigmatarchaeota archaeon]
MRKIIFNKIVKRTGFGLFFIALSYAMDALAVDKLLLGIRPGLGGLDFLYVLAVAFLPQVLSGIGFGILFSVAVLLLRYILLPVHMVERHYLGIKAWGYRKPLLICAAVAFLVFVLPFFLRSPVTTGQAVTGAEVFATGIGQGAYALGGYPGMILGPLWAAAVSLLGILLLKPLYLFSPVRLDAFLAGL